MARAQIAFFVLRRIVIALALSWAAVAQNDGASLFKRHCAICHGEDGAAKTAAGQKMKMPNLHSDKVQKQSDSQIFNSVANGTGHKEYPHAFLHRDLTKSQIETLVTYIRQLPKTKK